MVSSNGRIVNGPLVFLQQSQAISAGDSHTNKEGNVLCMMVGTVHLMDYLCLYSQLPMGFVRPTKQIHGNKRHKFKLLCPIGKSPSVSPSIHNYSHLGGL